MEVAERRRQQRYDTLIQAAIPGRSTMEGFQAVADYLSKEQYFGPLERILEVLDASKIPLIDNSGSARLEHLNRAHIAVSSCIPLFRSLLYAQRSTRKLETYTQRCLETLLELWDGVVQWMLYLVTHAVQYERTRQVCQDCADALFAIFAKLEENLMKQELLSIPGTANLVYRLLCQTDRQTGRYLILRPFEVPEAVCSMTQLFGETLADGAIWNVMGLEWESKSFLTRRRYASALIGRVKQMVEMVDIDNMAAMSKSVFWLVSATVILAGDWSRLPFYDLDRQNFLLECASALTHFAQKVQRHGAVGGCWEGISMSMLFLVDHVLNSSPNPSRYMRPIIEGGMLRCAFFCLPWDDPSRPFGKSAAVKSLQTMLPFLTIEGAYAAAAERQDFDAFFKAEHNTELSPNVQRICQDVREAALRGRRAFLERRGRPYNLCSNLKHPWSFASALDTLSATAVKTCSRCHSMFYCSAACQVQDWRDFHSQECAFLKEGYQRYKASKLWAPFTIWRDHLAFLEMLANFHLPPLPEYRQAMIAYSLCENPDDLKRTLPQGVQTYPPDAAISVFDTVAYDNPWPIHCHKTSLNTLRATWGRINYVLDPRIQKCVRDMQEQPERFVLVEGIFPFTEKAAMYVFAKMEYGPTAPKNETYRLVNSVFRVGERNLTFTANPEGFDDFVDPAKMMVVPIYAGPIAKLI